jgi:hypothetical protein
VRSLFFVNTRASTGASSGLNAFAPGDNNQAAAFVTIQSLATFPVASGVIALVWNILGGVGDWGDSRVVPFIAAVVVGAFLTIWSITDPASNMNKRDKLGAVFIGLVNILFLYAAAVGIDTSLKTGDTGVTQALHLFGR